MNEKVQISWALADYCLKVLKSQCAVVSHVERDAAVKLLRINSDELARAMMDFESEHGMARIRSLVEAKVRA